MNEITIESEANGAAKDPVPWLSPMVVMWTTVVIVIGLIVLGTWLNKQRSLADTKEVRKKFAAILDDFEFSAEERATLEEEFAATLAAAHSGDGRRATAQRLTERTMRSIECIALGAAVGAMDATMAQLPAGYPARAEVQARWPHARRQCDRLIFAVDQAGADQMEAVAITSTFLEDRKTWTPQSVDAFAAQCAAIADKAQAPAQPPEFNLYESLRRGIIAAREAEAIAD